MERKVKKATKEEDIDVSVTKLVKNKGRVFDEGIPGPHGRYIFGYNRYKKKKIMSLLIQEVPPTNAPIELLLLADPSEDKIRSYLPTSKCFVASICVGVVGACVVLPRGKGTYELMSIAVQPDHQKSGYGTALLKWVIDFFRDAGARQLEVGTGTFGYQLAFYQRHGFRVTGIDRDFFVKNYPEPIFEDGIQLFDMLRLTLRYTGEAA